LQQAESGPLQNPETLGRAELEETHTMRRLAAGLLIYLTFTACAADGGHVGRVTERDSAGIRILEYDAPIAQASLSLSEQPLFRHGGGPDDYPFQTIWDGALQPDGGAVVADGGNQDVVVLGPGGSFRSVLASRGAGPAEIRDVMSVTVLGQDAILVEDDGNGKLMLFQNGELASSLSTAAEFSITAGLRVLAVDGAEHALMGTSGFRPDFDQPWLAGHMVRVHLATGAADTVASYDMVKAANRGAPMNPFAPVGQAVASRYGFVYGRSDTAELAWRDPTGRLHQVVRWKVDRVFPTDAYWTEWTAQMRAELRRVNPRRSGQALEDLLSRQLARFKMDPSLPLPIWSTLLADVEGRSWIAEYSLGGATTHATRYIVLGPSGEWLGTLQAPPRFRLLDAGYGRVLGVQKDAMDVEYLVAYELLASDSRP
jgi:hypothetical protein